MNLKSILALAAITGFLFALYADSYERAPKKQDGK